jgi:aspartate/methionine/tyrosine aminotransferase
MKNNDLPTEQIIVAKRMSLIKPFRVMEVLTAAKKLEADGVDIIHMEVGEPDFATPQPIIEAGLHALQQGKTKYTPAAGIIELREKIAAYYADKFGVEISPQRIVITPGASGALQLVLATLINQGDEVLIPDPGYPCNRHFVQLFDGKAVALNVDHSTNYQPTLEQLEAAWTEKTKVLMLASPANPTGALISHQQLIKFKDFVRAKNGVLLVDEIYQGLVYDQDSITALATMTSAAENVFVINSFSKYFGMTGWRLGWVVAPEQHVETLDRLAQNLFLCAPTPSQYAAIAAFDPDCLDIMENRRAQFKQRRDFLLPALESLGFSIPQTPAGAFYLYANSQKIAPSSSEFCQQALQQAGVAITPGMDFGDNQPDQHIRFAYTTSLERLEEAVERLGKLSYFTIE